MSKKSNLSTNYALFCDVYCTILGIRTIKWQWYCFFSPINYIHRYFWSFVVISKKAVNAKYCRNPEDGESLIVSWNFQDTSTVEAIMSLELWTETQHVEKRGKTTSTSFCLAKEPMQRDFKQLECEEIQWWKTAEERRGDGLPACRTKDFSTKCHKNSYLKDHHHLILKILKIFVISVSVIHPPKLKKFNFG